MHDFEKWPELTNKQMTMYYFQSPHKQITESFWADVVKVIDGDTIRVKADFRNFDFPVRFAEIDTPESNTTAGQAATSWLASEILGKEVFIEIDESNRVGKWGRLIGKIIHNGIELNEEAIRQRHAKRL